MSLAQLSPSLFSPIFILKGEISQFSFFQKVGGYFAWKMVLNGYNGSAIVWEGVWKCFFWYSTCTPLSHPPTGASNGHIFTYFHTKRRNIPNQFFSSGRVFFCLKNGFECLQWLSCSMGTCEFMQSLIFNIYPIILPPYPHTKRFWMGIMAQL